MPSRVLLVLAGACLAHSWTVLPDTDWADDCQDPYGKGKSASECADQCQARRDCAAVSWNGPNSSAHDDGCNFKCDLKGRSDVGGEEGVIVRKGYHGFNLRSVPSRPGLRANLCNVPPPAPVPPSPKTLCPANIPADWRSRCESADIAFSDTLQDPEDKLPEVGNGFVATVVTSDTIYAAGVFNGDAVAKRLDASMRARIPPLSTTVDVDGAKQAGVRMMDFERASFTQRSNFTGGDAGESIVHVEEVWYAHAVHRNLLVHEITVSASAAAAAAEGEAARVATQRRRLGDDGIVVRIGVAETDESDDISFKAVASARADEYAISGTTKIAEVGSVHTGVGLAANRLPENVTVAPGGAAVKLFALHAIVTSLENNASAADLGTAALTQLRSFVGQAGASMRASHEAAWKARHDAGHIEVEGDLVLAHAVNSSLYYIRASIREDWPYGLSPGGLASNGYYGHTFWDQETWMWPPLLMLDPGCARSALQYRFDRLPGARIKAQECGKKGHSWCPPGYKAPAEAAMFPWESASTGQEVQFSGGELGPWGEFEIHVTGDIALAARQFWDTTQDQQWLRNIGFPLVNATASFFAARASLNTKKHNASSPAYDILQVMGPDEYAVPVDNSAYTNAIARIALEFAVEAAGVLGESVPAKYAEVASGLTIEVSDTAPGREDLKGGYHPEYEGFPKSSGGSKHPVVKQADAIMLQYPLGVDMNQTVLANDLSFYDSITDPDGPAMTWAMFAIGWFTAGNYTASQGHFKRGFANVQMPYGVWTETPDGGTVNFITGAGGFLQSLVFGTSGMRIEKDQLTFKPPPPSATGTKASRLVLHSFHYRGSTLRQEVTKSTVVYELLGAGENAQPLTVACGDNAPQPLVAGKPVSFARTGACAIAAAS